MSRRSCLTLFSHAVFPVFVSTVSPQKYSEELLHILYLLFLVLTSFPMSSSCPPVLLSLSLQILCFTNTSQSSQDVTVLFNLLVFFGFIIWLKACSPLHKPNCVFSLIDGKLNVDRDARCRSLTACFQLLENMLGSEQISFINTRDLVQTYRMMKGLPAGQALGRGQAQSRPPFSFFFFTGGFMSSVYVSSVRLWWEQFQHLSSVSAACFYWAAIAAQRRNAAPMKSFIFGG